MQRTRLPPSPRRQVPARTAAAARAAGPRLLRAGPGADARFCAGIAASWTRMRLQRLPAPPCREPPPTTSRRRCRCAERVRHLAALRPRLRAARRALTHARRLLVSLRPRWLADTRPARSWAFSRGSPRGCRETLALGELAQTCAADDAHARGGAGWRKREAPGVGRKLRGRARSRAFGHCQAGHAGCGDGGAPRRAPLRCGAAPLTHHCACPQMAKSRKLHDLTRVMVIEETYKQRQARIPCHGGRRQAPQLTRLPLGATLRSARAAPATCAVSPLRACRTPR